MKYQKTINLKKKTKKQINQLNLEQKIWLK